VSGSEGVGRVVGVVGVVGAVGMDFSSSLDDSSLDGNSRS